MRGTTAIYGILSALLLITSTMVGAAGAIDPGDLPEGPPDLPEDPPEELPGDLPEEVPEDLPDELLELVPDAELLRQSDTTDAYATIIEMGGEDEVTQTAEGDRLTFTIEVYHYDQDEEDLRLDLSEREGETAILRFADHRILPDLDYDCENPTQPGHLNVCGTIGDDTFALSEDARQLTVTVAPSQLDEAELLGQPIGISAFIDVTDESGGPLGNYEAGNGAYNLAKLQVKETPVASTLDDVITPVALFGEDPTQASLLEILEPTEGASVVPGGALHVTWRAPANDLQQGAYRVEATAMVGGDTVETTDYVCSGIAGTDQVRCTTEALGTPLQLTDAEGTWNVLVHAPVHEEVREQDAKLLCSLQATLDTSLGQTLGLCDAAQIEVGPITELRTTPTAPDGDADWFTSEVEVEIACTAAAGCDRIEYRVDDGPTVASEEPFTVEDGTHTVTYSGEDVFGNAEPVQQAALQQDTQAPTTELTTDPASPAGQNGWFLESPTLTLTCTDAASGCDGVTYALDDGPEETLPGDGGDITGLSEGTHEVAYGSQDTAGLVEATSTAEVSIDTADPVIDLLCPLDGSDCYPEGATITDPELEARLEASDTGAGVTTKTVTAENPDGQTIGPVEVTGDTVDLDVRELLDSPLEGVHAGTITLTAEVTDGAGRTVTQSTSSLDLNTHPEETIRIELANDPDTFVPSGTAVDLEYTGIWIGGDRVGEPVQSAELSLLDTGTDETVLTLTTDSVGTASGSLTESDLQRTLAIEVASHDGVATEVPGDLVVTWADLQLDRLPDEETNGGSGYADIGSSYEVVYKVTASHDDGGLQGAKVILDDGSGTTSETAGEDGTVTLDVSRATPSTVSFDATATFNPDDGPSQQVSDDAFTLRWAQLVVTSASADPSGGWHNVGDSVSFELTAELDDGTVDPAPAEGATITLAAGAEEATIDPLDATGTGSTSMTFSGVTVTTPAVDKVTTPQGITAFVEEDVGEQIWTEIDLDATATGDTFVNVGEAIPVSLSASWAHDDSDVGLADVEVQTSDGTPRTTCTVADGSGTCDVTRDVVDDAGLTFVVTSTDQGPTRQLGGTPATLEAVWTEIVVSGTSVDDSFVNVGDTVTFTGTATYAHDASMDVPSATLALASTAPAACSLGTGEVTDGALTATVTCEEVVDAQIPLEVTAADDDVTVLAKELAFDSVWTALDVSYVADQAHGAVLDHNAPVGFETTVTFAHIDGTGPDTPAPAGTQIQVAVEADQSHTCLIDVDAGATTCSVDVSAFEGAHEYTVSATSHSDGDGPAGDITEMAAEPAPITLRWTSIGFDGFTCESPTTEPGDCEDTTWENGETVTVTVTAVAQDTLGDEEPEILTDALIEIEGQELEADENGQATYEKVGFNTCATITARGLTATIDGQTVTWTTSHSETICWGEA